MIHPIEHIAAGTIVLCLGALVWLSGPPTPRPKPEEFVLPPVEFVEPASQEQTATIRAKPLPLKTEQQTVDDVTTQAKNISKELEAILKELEAERAAKRKEPVGQ